MTGQTFSHYEILDKIGEGGMGVVYRARARKFYALRAFDMAPDGERAADIMPADLAAEKARGNRAVFLQNFFDELRRQVPAVR